LLTTFHHGHKHIILSLVGPTEHSIVYTYTALPPRNKGDNQTIVKTAFFVGGVEGFIVKYWPISDRHLHCLYRPIIRAGRLFQKTRFWVYNPKTT